MGIEGDVKPVSGTKDFFISYNNKDKGWAEWIAYILEKESYSVIIQAWHILPGSNFVVEMHKAASECKKTIAVLSPDYLASMFTQAEWAVAFSVDPTGAERKLIPIRVRMCEPPGLLRTIVYCDLLGLTEDAAKGAVLRAVITGRHPTERPPFPDTKSEMRSTSSILSVPNDASYPGVFSQSSLGRTSPPVKAAAELLSLVRTTRTAFEAQSRLRDGLVRDVMERLIVDPRRLNYEAFLAEHATALTPKEGRTFKIIRGFTETVFFDYNTNGLLLLQNNPLLEAAIPSAAALRDHLTLWITKYQAVFVDDPTMALLYIGVDEGVPYPIEVEREIWRYLESKGEMDGLLRTEEPPETEFREGASSDGHWFRDQVKRWNKKEFSEVKAEISGLSGAHVPEELDIRLASIVSEIWYPSCIWLRTDAPINDIIGATKNILLL